jgi:hypothetical protein
MDYNPNICSQVFGAVDEPLTDLKDEESLVNVVQGSSINPRRKRHRNR